MSRPTPDPLSEVLDSKGSKNYFPETVQSIRDSIIHHLLSFQGRVSDDSGASEIYKALESLNDRGAIAEASVANLFVVRRGTLATPPSSDGGLEGDGVLGSADTPDPDTRGEGAEVGGGGQCRDQLGNIGQVDDAGLLQRVRCHGVNRDGNVLQALGPLGSGHDHLFHQNVFGSTVIGIRSLILRVGRAVRGQQERDGGRKFLAAQLMVCPHGFSKFQSVMCEASFR